MFCSESSLYLSPAYHELFFLYILIKKLLVLHGVFKLQINEMDKKNKHLVYETVNCIVMKNELRNEKKMLFFPAKRKKK